MFRQKVKYEIYDGDTLIDTGTASELADRFYTGPQQITERARDGHLLQKKYKVRSLGMQACNDYAEQDSLIKADYEKGMMPTAISKHLGVSVQTVRYRLQGLRERGEIV